MSMMSASEIIYREKQRLRSPWLWGILLPTTGIFLYGTIGQLFYQIPFLIPISEITLILISTVFCLLVAVFYFLEMETLVKEEGIYLRLGVTKGAFKFIPFSDVLGYKSVRYNSLDYGGRGICHKENCLAFTIRGKDGIEFTLLNDKKLLVGTTDPEDFISSLNKMRILY